jgi:hypothetical protein
MSKMFKFSGIDTFPEKLCKYKKIIMEEAEEFLLKISSAQ